LVPISTISELNFLWESWLKFFTNNKPEAIVNDSQNKGLNEYRHLMNACFKEAYRVLKRPLDDGGIFQHPGSGLEQYSNGRSLKRDSSLRMYPLWISTA
jgi:hypothetical protein